MFAVSGLVLQKFGDLFRGGELAFEFSRQAFNHSVGGDADRFTGVVQGVLAYRAAFLFAEDDTDRRIFCWPASRT